MQRADSAGLGKRILWTGHLPPADLSRRLEAMGFVRGSTRWLTAWNLERAGRAAAGAASGD